MKVLSFFIFFLFAPNSQAQYFAQDVLQELEKQEGYLLAQQKTVEKDKKAYEKAINLVEKYEEDLEKLNSYEENFQTSRNEILAELNSKIKDFPIYSRIGRKIKFYKCLRDSLEKEVLNKHSCFSDHNPKLSAEENNRISDWLKRTGTSIAETTQKKEWLVKDIKKWQDEAGKADKALAKSVSLEEKQALIVRKLERQKEEINLLPAHAGIYKCDENTAEVNLEEETPYPGASFTGPFVGVPRDNQDGLGTCYANAAKNMLVGLSGGKDVASFLDVALQLQDKRNAIASEGLNFGSVCEALESLEERGYCPQGFSPLETGETNEIGEHIFKLDSYEYLASNISLMRDFISDVESFKSKTSEFDKNLLSKAETIITALKTNPKIHLPLPIVKRPVIEHSKLRELYYLKKLKTKNISEDEFLSAYNEAYRKFYPDYLKAVLENKSLDEVFGIFENKIGEFFSKYELIDKLPSLKSRYEQLAGEDYKDPELSEKVKVSFDYLKEITNKKELSNDLFIAYCSEMGLDGLDFLSSLAPVIEKIRSESLNSELLFNKDGSIKSAKDLMQLTIAPSCINENNRKDIPRLTCSGGTDVISKIKNKEVEDAEKIKMLRERVVLSLVQGLPLGNTFHAFMGTYHINTIVGIRFDPESKQCQYRIRESMDATSSWQNEDEIFKNITALTEVRKD